MWLRVPVPLTLLCLAVLAGSGAARAEDSLDPEIAMIETGPSTAAPAGGEDVAAGQNAGDEEEADVVSENPGPLVNPGPEGQLLREAVVANHDAAGALALGWAYYDRNQWENAGQWFGRSLELDPGSRRAAEGLIMSTYRSGDPAGAYRLAAAHAELVPEGRSIVAQAAAAAGLRLAESGEVETAQALVADLPATERPVAAVHQAIARREVDTAVARENYEEARAVAAAHSLDPAPVDREESAALLRRAADAREAGKTRESLQLVERAEEVAPLERGGEKLKAWSLHHNRRYGESARIFEKLYRESPDRESANGLASSLEKAGELRQLGALSQELGGPLAAASEPALFAAARSESGRQRREAALAAAPPARREPAEAPGGEPGAEGGPAPLPALAAAAAAMAPGDPIARGARPVPDSSLVRAGGAFRSKSGEAGLDRLRVTHLPSVETTLVFGQGRRRAVTLGVHALSLDSGVYRGDRLVGSAASTLDPGPFVTETDTMAELRLSYRAEKGRQALVAGLGTTPLGAQIAAAPVGEIGVEWNSGRAGFAARGFSRSVTESVLSYVGMADPHTGESWGRVRRSGARAEGAVDLGGGWSSHGMLEFSGLHGESVARNHAFAADIGLAYHLDLPGFERVAIGPTFHYEAYDKNLSHFTTGHGGYFSPDQLYQGMLGVSFLTETGKNWLAEGFVGLGAQAHETAATPLLPLAPDGRFYGAGSESSAIFSARIQAILELNPQWRLGAQAGYAKTAAYEDFAVSVYLSFLFEPAWGLGEADLSR